MVWFLVAAAAVADVSTNTPTDTFLGTTQFVETSQTGTSTPTTTQMTTPFYTTPSPTAEPTDQAITTTDGPQTTPSPTAKPTVYTSTTTFEPTTTSLTSTSTNEPENTTTTTTNTRPTYPPGKVFNYDVDTSTVSMLFVTNFAMNQTDRALDLHGNALALEARQQAAVAVLEETLIIPSSASFDVRFGQPLAGFVYTVATVEYPGATDLQLYTLANNVTLQIMDLADETCTDLGFSYDTIDYKWKIDYYRRCVVSIDPTGDENTDCDRATDAAMIECEDFPQDRTKYRGCNFNPKDCGTRRQRRDGSINVAVTATQGGDPPCPDGYSVQTSSGTELCIADSSPPQPAPTNQPTDGCGAGLRLACDVAEGVFDESKCLDTSVLHQEQLLCYDSYATEFCNYIEFIYDGILQVAERKSVNGRQGNTGDREMVDISGFQILYPLAGIFDLGYRSQTTTGYASDMNLVLTEPQDTTEFRCIATDEPDSTTTTTTSSTSSTRTETTTTTTTSKQITIPTPAPTPNPITIPTRAPTAMPTSMPTTVATGATIKTFAMPMSIGSAWSLAVGYGIMMFDVGYGPTVSPFSTATSNLKVYIQ